MYHHTVQYHAHWGGAGWEGGRLRAHGGSSWGPGVGLTRREQDDGQQQDVLSLVQPQLLQADVELEQRLQVDLLEPGWRQRWG